MKEKSGGYCGGVPPLPIPNREVKPTCADGTAQQCGRVGSRLLLRSEALETEMSSGLFCVYPVFLLCYLRNPFYFILSSFRIVFGALLFLSCLSSVLPSGLFCVYPVFFPYCLRNRLVLLLSFLRVIFGILLCLFCLPLELLSESFCVCIVFALCLFCFCLFFVLFSNRINISSV